ncbi:MAG: TrkH family potassium uptake protein [Gaiellaceae bacterium]
MAGLSAWLKRRHPAQYLVSAFAIGIVVGAGLLLLPFATETGERASFLTAIFTSTSSICVTGLVVVDTPTYWSTFGEVVIMLLVQVGGLGIMTLASLLVFLLAGRLGLRGRLLAQAEVAAPLLADVRRLVFAVIKLSLLFEAVGASVLALRFWTGYEYSLGRSIYLGIFHAITAFNNAGFALWTDNLTPFATDGWICVTIALLIIAGGLGFPVWLELSRLYRRPHSWTLHTKLTLLLTALLLVGGTAAVLAFEWGNTGTLGQFGPGGKLLAGFFQAVSPRTAGFNTVDYGEMELETLFVTDFLMFVGAGSASTGGGIKVTTLALLALMVWAEVRGDPHVTAFSRRLPAHTQRQAFTVATVALSAVVVSTLALMAYSEFTLSQSLFESLSAFGTVGLSTGITADIAPFGQWILVALMYLGRVGPHTLGVALALRERQRLYRFPEERPIIG